MKESIIVTKELTKRFGFIGKKWRVDERNCNHG